MTLLFLCGLLGLFINVSVQLRRMQILFNKANKVFVPSEYFKNEYMAIVVSLLVLFAGVIVKSEVIAAKPNAEKFIKCLFIFWGYFGTGIFLAVMGKTKSYILAVIDRKTDIADGKTPAPIAETESL